MIERHVAIHDTNLACYQTIASFDAEDDDYVPYIPIKQRRLEKLHKYATQRRVTEQPDNNADDDEDDVIVAGPKANISLLDQTVQQKLANAVPGKREMNGEAFKC